MKKRLMTGVLAAAVTALVALQGTRVAAEPASQLWTIFVHFEYADGFSYDYPLRRGVTTSEMPSFLRECGRAHSQPSVVRHYCFPVAE